MPLLAQYSLHVAAPDFSLCAWLRWIPIPDEREWDWAIVSIIFAIIFLYFFAPFVYFLFLLQGILENLVMPFRYLFIIFLYTSKYATVWFMKTYEKNIIFVAARKLHIGFTCVSACRVLSLTRKQLNLPKFCPISLTTLRRPFST